MWVESKAPEPTTRKRGPIALIGRLLLGISLADIPLSLHKVSQ